MKLANLAVALGIAGSLLTSTIATAAETRSATALPRAHGAVQPQQVRASKQMNGQSDLLGAPLFIAFLGAVAVTIGTIVIINNDNNSPG